MTQHQHDLLILEDDAVVPAQSEDFQRRLRRSPTAEGRPSVIWSVPVSVDTDLDLPEVDGPVLASRMTGRGAAWKIMFIASRKSTEFVVTKLRPT